MKEQFYFNVFKCISFVVMLLWLNLSYAEEDVSTEAKDTPTTENGEANLKELPTDELLAKIATLLQSVNTAKEAIVQQIQQLRTQQDNAKTVEDVEYYNTMLADYAEQLTTLNKREEELKNLYQQIKHQVECINGTALPEKTCQ